MGFVGWWVSTPHGTHLEFFFYKKSTIAAPKVVIAIVAGAVKDGKILEN